MADAPVPARPAWLDVDAYPFASRAVLVEGHAIHYVDEGEGAPVVLVHGTPTWSFEYRHVIAALRARRRCLALDHLGFGLSARPLDADYSPRAHARRFAAFIDALGLSRMTLVVHDYGGPIALDWATRHPDALERLVVLNSWMWPFDDDPLMRRRARMIRGALGRLSYRHLNASLRLVMPSAYGDRGKLTPAIHRQYLELFPDPDGRELVLFALARGLSGSSDFFGELWSRRDALAPVPTGIVWGLADSAFRPEQLARWRRACPHADVVALEGVGHWPHEEAPDRVVAALEDWGV